MTQQAGQIEVDCYIVRCGATLPGCREAQQLPESLFYRAKAEARRLGWRLTHRWGWVCPECATHKRLKRD